MKKKLFVGLATGLLTLGIVGTSNATIIDFEGMSYSNQNTITIGDVTFADSSGSGLNVRDWGHQSDGVGLAVYGDDSSRLELSFDNYYNYLSFDFGNDNPGFGDPDGQMHLDLYNDGSLVSSFSLTANWDDIMNQSLSGTGTFNYAEIYYDTNLIEVIDNIEYLNTAPVPEPATMLLFATGIAGLVGNRIRRKKK